MDWIRWILLANHTEPVQGLLRRFLRRRLIQSELESRSRDRELERIIEWIPRCWQHLNSFLEAHNSADVTVGPRWFLQVPKDSTCSQVPLLSCCCLWSLCLQDSFHSFQWNGWIDSLPVPMDWVDPDLVSFACIQGLVYGFVELHAGTVLAPRGQGRIAALRETGQVGRSCQLGPLHLPVESRIGLRRPHEVPSPPLSRPSFWSIRSFRSFWSLLPFVLNSFLIVLTLDLGWGVKMWATTWPPGPDP